MCVDFKFHGTYLGSVSRSLPLSLLHTQASTQTVWTVYLHDDKLVTTDAGLAISQRSRTLRLGRRRNLQGERESEESV